MMSQLLLCAQKNTSRLAQAPPPVSLVEIPFAVAARMSAQG